MFKVGDRVLCVAQGIHKHIKNNSRYTITYTDKYEFVNVNNVDIPLSEYRFILLTKNEIRKEKLEKLELC